MVNYFEILNISENAEPEVIRASYRALSKKYHPDSNISDKGKATKQMALINEAYEVLSDNKKREEHIQKLRQERTDAKKKDATSPCPSPSKANEHSSKLRSAGIGLSADDIAGEAIQVVIVIIITVSLVCCAVHFIPDMAEAFWNTLKGQIEEILYNFHLV